MKIRILFLILLNAALSRGVFAVQAPPPGFTPVEAAKLEHGLTLTLKDAKCSVEAPDQNWKWLANASAENYLCFNTKTGQSFTVSIGKLHNEIDEHTRGEILDGVKKSAAAQKATFSDVKFEKSEVPLPGKSWRLSYLLTLSGGAKITVIIYVVNPGEHALVTLQDSSLDGKDSPAFKKFVSSMKAVK
jgi:hypothetical protein